MDSEKQQSSIQTLNDKELWEDDWRLKDRPWDYMYNVRLSYVRAYRPYRKSWDHEHCAFCFTSIGPFPGEKSSGYCTSDKEPSRQEWICETCYRDFAPLFSWTVKEYPELIGQNWPGKHSPRRKRGRRSPNVFCA